ncbi:Uncharacterised protein [Capnocytophaga ochracea]|uniref:Uncharacterized protein n=1 Tax=Capnocytophaga ochracea TaxID=1018 RepID=A0A2X2UTY0_CAPOC|nr:Uncharacterised protein [Capnocytophaga ochracea]
MRKLGNEKMRKLTDWEMETKRNEKVHNTWKGTGRVVLAYRKLIGSLYESWKMGIEKVYKYLNISFLRELKQ